MTVMGLITYGPAAWLEYGRADDYWFVLHNAVNAPQANAQNLVEGGRFVAALIGRWAFPHVDTVSELVLMRLAAIAALSLTGAALSLMALRLMCRPRTPASLVLALLVGLVALVTPAAPSAATWGVMALELWALPLALVGGLAATAQRRFMGLRWEMAVAILVLLAAFTYQVAAAACLLPVYLWSAVRWARNEAPQWRRPIVVTGLLVASLACDVALVKLFHLAGDDRLGGHGLTESVVWFVAGYLPRTVDFGVPVSVDSLGVTLLVLALALLSPIMIRRRFLALPASVVAAWFVASVIVIPGELWATYRLVMTPQTMLWSGSAVCLAFAVREQHATRPRAAVSLLAGTSIGASALLAVSGFRAYEYLAKPNAVDWASVQCVVRDAPPLSERTVLVLNPFNASVSPIRASDEYGIIASSTLWALPDITWLAAEIVGPSGLPPRVPPNQLRVVTGSSDEVSSRGALRFRQDACGSVYGSP